VVRIAVQESLERFYQLFCSWYFCSCRESFTRSPWNRLVKNAICQYDLRLFTEASPACRAIENCPFHRVYANGSPSRRLRTFPSIAPRSPINIDLGPNRLLGDTPTALRFS
jgi:hypothetical protein